MWLLDAIKLFEANYLEKVGRQWSTILDKVPTLGPVDFANVNVAAKSQNSSGDAKRTQFTITPIGIVSPQTLG